jgi:hypothetical protein
MGNRIINADSHGPQVRCLGSNGLASGMFLLLRDVTPMLRFLGSVLVRGVDDVEWRANGRVARRSSGTIEGHYVPQSVGNDRVAKAEVSTSQTV